MKKIYAGIAGIIAVIVLMSCSPVPQGPFPASVPPSNGCGASMVLWNEHTIPSNMFAWAATGRSLMSCYGPNVGAISARTIIDRCNDNQWRDIGGQGVVCKKWTQRAVSIWVYRNQVGGPNPHVMITFQDGLQASSNCRIGQGQHAGFWRVATEMKAQNGRQHVVQRRPWVYLFCG